MPEPLRKRVRLSNILSLFGALVLLASIPFDRVTAPPWMVSEDIAGAVAYLAFPVLNRWGRFTLSRLLLIVVSNLIVLGNAVLLGHDSGAEVVFVALVAVPFTLFDIGERAPLALGVAMALVCFGVAHADLFAAYRSISPNYSPAWFHLYSAVIALVIILFSAVQTSLANARVERALRQDIADRQRAERELSETRQSAVYAAKMAALGEMSGNVAHEVNNPLAAMLIRAQRLRRMAAGEAPNREAIVKGAADIESLVHRIRRIVDALRSFARDAEKDPMQPEPVAKIVSETIELCAERFRQHDIQLVVEPIPADVQVVCRGVQISQILLNLLGNAHDAVEGQPVRRVAIRVEPEAATVRIAVVDSGPGIPAGLEGRIMEPFFTTKEIGKGTGLGLSVSKGIAEAHGGELRLDRGAPETRFVLTLRRASPSEKQLDPEGEGAVP